MKSEDLTFLIPAAGNSSRFKAKESKIFYIFKKKTLIEHIINKVKKFTHNIIIVSNKKNYKKLRIICKHYTNLKIKIVFQNRPKGMGDAVNIGLSKVKTLTSAVIWADQIFIGHKTLKKTLSYFKLTKSLLCFPVIKKKNPYVYVNFKNNNFHSIIQTRESGKKILNGFSDCGFFVFKTKEIKKKLKELIKQKKIITKKTKEIDFLQSFKYLKKVGNIKTIRAISTKDSIGINYLEDLK
jgi:bifunctional N-acetylglucosamine-1-phosphate-uridyltransferase/glucosamine-1-phosphate-acetyltransferase GlmU-like protein